MPWCKISGVSNRPDRAEQRKNTPNEGVHSAWQSVREMFSMKTYVFELTIHEGSDEWWESKPGTEQVAPQIADALEDWSFRVIS